ncbi:fatty-acid amide hydrolase 2-like [Arctopsyche grandis]|uniref:fatty-acid amide hydrolase 2-like n=1 Tax=Arctopsyche grandis TaxID=121162 RepID=UPI00406D8871
MEIGVRIVGFLLLIIDFITTPFYWIASRRHSKKKLPPIRDPLLLLSGTKLADLIRRKQVSSQHIIEIFIKRVKEVNPFLNAVVEDRFREAIEESKNVDRYLDGISNDDDLKKLEVEKPFFGVPISVKESCSVSGMSQSVGSLPRAGTKAINDCQAVANMKALGAIPLLISNTPELCLSWESTNLITGRTNNPYSMNRTCGGSSGGEAALIASGASVCGVASDIAGSIRIPAMFNGIFGHKPSSGISPIDGHYPTSTDENFSKFLTIGPLTRYSEDLKPMLKALAGNNAEILKLDEPVDLKDLKVLYMMEAGKSFVMIPVNRDIQGVMLKALNYLENQHNVKVEKAKFKEMEDSVEISVSVFFGMQDIPNMLRDENNPKHQKNVYIEFIKSILGLGSFSPHSLGFYLLHATNLFIPKTSYKSYCNQAKQLEEKIQRALGTNGVFLYPTFPIPAFYHNQVFTKPAGVLYTMIFNILGLPSTHVPLGLDSNGLPIGIQVVAARNQDRLCLAVAKELEKGFGGWVKPPMSA